MRGFYTKQAGASCVRAECPDAGSALQKDLGRENGKLETNAVHVCATRACCSLKQRRPKLCADPAQVHRSSFCENLAKIDKLLAIILETV